MQKELQECNRDFEVSGIKVVPKGETNLAHLLGSIPGPLGTPYEGGIFKIDIVLPGNLFLSLSRVADSFKFRAIVGFVGTQFLLLNLDSSWFGF